MRQVRRLELSNCIKITDEGFWPLKYITHLKIAFSKITDAGLAHLGHLRSLDLEYCSKITDDGLRFLSGLHMLKLIRCRGITNAGLKYLTRIHTLTIISYDHSSKMTKKELKRLSWVYDLNR